jgi:streptogrisin D
VRSVLVKPNVSTTFHKAKRPNLFSRRVDTFLTSAGAQIWVYGSNWGICSSGFSVNNPFYGRGFMTAGHCSSYVTGGSVFNGDFSLFEGTVFSSHIPSDSSFVRNVASATSIGRTYDGGVGSGEFFKPVTGYQGNNIGSWVCTSGGLSGAMCNIQVKQTNYSYPSGWNGQWYGPLVGAEQVNHQSASGTGDSGGPVFALASDPSKSNCKGNYPVGFNEHNCSL